MSEVVIGVILGVTCILFLVCFVSLCLCVSQMLYEAQRDLDKRTKALEKRRLARVKYESSPQNSWD